MQSRSSSIASQEEDSHTFWLDSLSTSDFVRRKRLIGATDFIPSTLRYGIHFSIPVLTWQYVCTWDVSLNISSQQLTWAWYYFSALQWGDNQPRAEYSFLWFWILISHVHLNTSIEPNTFLLVLGEGDKLPASPFPFSLDNI